MQRAKVVFPRLNAEALEKLAKDIFEGLIFTDRHIPEEGKGQILTQIFIPLRYLPKGVTIGDFLEDAGLIWEYKKEAGLGKVLGMPQFFTLNAICKEDALLLDETIKQLKKG